MATFSNDDNFFDDFDAVFKDNSNLCSTQKPKPLTHLNYNGKVKESGHLTKASEENPVVNKPKKVFKFGRGLISRPSSFSTCTSNIQSTTATRTNSQSSGSQNGIPSQELNVESTVKISTYVTKDLSPVNGSFKNEIRTSKSKIDLTPLKKQQSASLNVENIDVDSTQSQESKSTPGTLGLMKPSSAKKSFKFVKPSSNSSTSESNTPNLENDLVKNDTYVGTSQSTTTNSVPKKSTDDYDSFLLSNIDWENEEDWNEKDLNIQILDSPPRTQSNSGITLADYVDDDFDISTLDSPPPGPSEHSSNFSFNEPPQTNSIEHQTVDLNCSFNPNASISDLPGPSNELRFTPIDKDVNVRKDDTPSFQKTYPHTQVLRDILHEKFGLKDFRPNQQEIINAALEQHDCFVLMPTGGGKSLCYQLPAILTPGVTIVISPLRALITDQVNKLNSLDIPAAHMCADQTKSEFARIACLLGELEPGLKLLYLTPEKIIGSKATFEMLTGLYNRGKLSRIVLDEAHCLSHWGHDFRPDYKQLSTLRRTFVRTPIMCLTATATSVVQQDVINVLKLKNVKTFIRSFNRPNIRYTVLEKNKTVATEEIIKLIKASFRRMSGIVYSLCRKDCDTLAVDLRKSGIKAQSYHAGLSDKQREKVQAQWMNNEYHVICATIAFGMGIDKPDVRFVIHNSLPKSVEAFYQESGRGGRDGDPAYSYLFYAYSDVVRLQKIIRLDKSISKKNLEAHFDQIQQMAQYCENKTDCRRYLQLLHLGEKFDRRLCMKDRKTICDNCTNFGTVQLRDVRKECRELATIVKDIGTSRNFTMLHFVDIYRGAKVKKVLDWKHHMHKYFGGGSHLTKSDIHRILKHLSFKKVLVDSCNYTGEFPIIYIKPGPNYEHIFAKNASVTIPVLKNKGRSRMPQELVCERPMSRDTESPVDVDMNAPQAKRPLPKPAAKKTNNSPGKSLESQIYSLKVKCHEELLEKCAEFAAQLHSNLSSIMNLSAIKAMSDELPDTPADFLKIQYVTKANFEKYGNAFLLITQKYRKERDKLEAQEALADVNMDSDDDNWASTSSTPTDKAAPARGVKRKLNRFKNTTYRWKSSRPK